MAQLHHLPLWPIHWSCTSLNPVVESHTRKSPVYQSSWLPVASSPPLPSPLHKPIVHPFHLSYTHKAKACLQSRTIEIIQFGFACHFLFMVSQLKGPIGAFEMNRIKHPGSKGRRVSCNRYLQSFLLTPVMCRGSSVGDESPHLHPQVRVTGSGHQACYPCQIKCYILVVAIPTPHVV